MTRAKVGRVVIASEHTAADSHSARGIKDWRNLIESHTKGDWTVPISTDELEDVYSRLGNIKGIKQPQGFEKAVNEFLEVWF